MGTNLSQSRYRVGQSEDLSAQRNVVPLQVVRVTTAVPPLVMSQNEIAHRSQIRDGPDGIRTPMGVLVDFGSGFLRENGLGVLPSVLHHADHTHIGKDRTKEEGSLVFFGKTEALTQAEGDTRDPGAMVEQISVPCTHDLNKGLEETRVERTS